MLAFFRTILIALGFLAPAPVAPPVYPPLIVSAVQVSVAPTLAVKPPVLIAHAPIVKPVNAKLMLVGGTITSSTWIGAYETPVYNTASWKLEVNQYFAIAGGFIGMMATSSQVSSTTGQLVTYPAHIVFSKQAINGMTQVTEIGKAYYDIFDVSGVRKEQATTLIQYQSYGGKILVEPTYITTP